MKKQDEIDLFEFLIYCTEKMEIKQPGRNLIEEYGKAAGVPINRIGYILSKWDGCGIWSYGVNVMCGWFEKDAIEIFNRKNIDRLNIDKRGNNVN